MDILDQIREDHEQVNDTLEELIQGGGGRGKQSASISKLRGALLSHAKAEEAVLYPPSMENDEARAHMLKAVEEHHVIEMVLGAIGEGADDQERTVAKLSVLRDIVEHHVDEEESETFDFAHEMFEDEELDEMGERFMKEKEKRMARA